VILDAIAEAVTNGSTVEAAAAAIGLTARTVERWKKAPEGVGDLRAGPKTTPPHALTADERKRIVELATSAEYRNISVRQLVPGLADKGVYVASESSFYRVLHEEGLMAHRGHARPASGKSKPRSHVATGPRQVWTWDITYLRAAVRGTFYYLYLVLDIWSRKVVAWEVHDEESMDLASDLAAKASVAEGVRPGELVLHSDNGGPMKGATMLATLQRLGIAASFSRPRVSDDNAMCEAIFRTLKYRPGFPRKPFASVDEARRWVEDFVAWYNGEHLHSGLRYVTPNDRHEGRDGAILANRKAVYRDAKKRTPRRWTGQIRNWSTIGDVTLNPERGPIAA
jgi:transposase InsO family protein